MDISSFKYNHCLKPNPTKTQAIILGTAANVNQAHSLNQIPLVINGTQML